MQAHAELCKGGGLQPLRATGRGVPAQDPRLLTVTLPDGQAWRRLPGHQAHLAGEYDDCKAVPLRAGNRQLLADPGFESVQRGNHPHHLYRNGRSTVQVITSEPLYGYRALLRVIRGKNNTKT